MNKFEYIYIYIYTDYGKGGHISVEGAVANLN